LPTTPAVPLALDENLGDQVVFENGLVSWPFEETIILVHHKLLRAA
jgi:hypothetical protein